MVLTINQTIVEPEFDTVPDEMRALNNWVLWKAIETNEVNEDGERILSKVLKRSDGRSAKSNDSDTWTDFHTAYSSYASGRFSGIGFVFEKKNKIIGLDLDGHFDDMQPITDIAEYICSVTYTEISPSGTGAHAYFIGNMPDDFKKKYKDGEGELEIYNDKRFYTFTGVSVGQDEICNDQSVIDELVNNYFYQEPPKELDVLPANETAIYSEKEIMRRMLRNEKINKLFNGDTSQHDYDMSSADLAFANHLAFYTAKNAAQMDNIFRQSELYRDKWDKVHSSAGLTYGEMTIREAISKCRNVYSPALGNKETEDTLWEDVVSFDDGTVVEFPDGIFPDWLENYIDAVSLSTQTPKDMAAMGAFSALSIALTKKYSVNVYGDWIEPLNTYLLTLMPPASKKSSVFNTMMKPIYDYQDMKEKEMEVAVEQNHNEIDLKEKLIQSMKAEYSKEKNKKKANQIKEDINYAIEDLKNIEVLHKPTYIADDVTPEVLAKLMQENNEKLGIISAEGGLFSTVKGKYSDVSNIDIFLSGHPGDRMSAHRLSRDTVTLKKPLLSIGVFAQPSVIEDLPEEFFSRGLMARFLYSLPEDNRGRREIRPTSIPDTLTKTYNDNITHLMNIKSDEDILSMSKEADVAVQLLQNEMEFRQAPGDDMSENESIGAWAGKIVGQLMRLAGLIHMSKSLYSDDKKISRDTIESIEELKEYFISHMKRAFSTAGADPRLNDAAFLWEKISDYQEDGELKRQKLWQNVKKKFSSAQDLDAALEMLSDRSYVKVEDVSNNNGKGRKTKMIRINPSLL